MKKKILSAALAAVLAVTCLAGCSAGSATDIVKVANDCVRELDRSYIVWSSGGDKEMSDYYQDPLYAVCFQFDT